MKAVGLASVLLLGGCAISLGRADQYLLVTDTAHGFMLWSRFDSLAICEEAKRVKREAARKPNTLNLPYRCISAGGVKRLWVVYNGADI